MEEWGEDVCKKMVWLIVDFIVGIEVRKGIIGVVVLDVNGKIVVGIFIGGKGLECIGWVSDFVMLVGNYVICFVGVSCIGVGEDIINECLVVKVVIWVKDG